MNNILVLPDAHVIVGEDVERFRALGRFIIKRRPTHIVCLGDFADMASLSSFESDLSKSELVGNYHREVKAVHKALDALFTPLRKLNKKQRKGKRKLYRPKTVMLGGNHEDARYDRAIEANPIILKGTISVEDLNYADYFDEVIPFKQAHTIEGISFVHYLSNLMGRALGGGVNPARNILSHAKQSIVVGHSHTYDYSISARLDGSKIHGLVAGCYTGDDKHHQYARGSSHNWTKGISMLNNAKNGNYELEFISQEKVFEN